MLDKECTLCAGNGVMPHEPHTKAEECQACKGTGLKPWARSKTPVLDSATYADLLDAYSIVNELFSLTAEDRSTVFHNPKYKAVFGRAAVLVQRYRGMLNG